ncbi:MAG: isoaspartyl peptidase/L-asparaginase [Longimicrobiales bacterium]
MLQSAPPPAKKPAFALVVHGGAGTISRTTMTPDMETQYRTALTEALQAGYRVLNGGGSSLDAIEAAIRTMEDSPLFNAGKGAVFTNDGKNELDAAIMDGSTLQAGSIAGVMHVKNPISLARMVMEKSPHVMMIGAGAEAFAQENGVTLVPEGYFFTQRRWDDLQKAKAAEAKKGGEFHDAKFGTVGVVALDRAGHLAAGTSSGGMTNKRWGRVGDVPIIGAGTFANAHCAVSGTGHGEYFIRNNVASDICARVEYLHETLDAAARHVVMDKLVKQGGEGGVIAMDDKGGWTMPFNSSGMYRGQIGVDGKASVWIYKDD